jgi:CheY-like chemotaxis protein
MARVLIIDDESNIRMMLRLALEHVGHTTGQAADGESGLAAFGTGDDWDLVLLDHRMPGIEGIDVLRTLRARRPDVAVIMVTAFGTIDLATEAIQAGATDFLRKPFTTEVLRETVAAALSRTSSPPHVANAVPTAVRSFEHVGINGFRLATLPGIERHADGGLGKRFSVQRIEGAGRSCAVVLSPPFVAEVTLHLDGGPAPGGDRFWEALCGEVLANYLWQNAALPSGGVLTADTLSRGLQRWVEAVVASSKAA